MVDGRLFEHRWSPGTGGGAGNDLQMAERAAAENAQLEAASNNVQAARESLPSVTQLESCLEIRAPSGGVVGPASGQAGALPIVRRDKDRSLACGRARAGGKGSRVREGQLVAFSAPAYPARTYHAAFERISHDIDQNTRNMQVELDFRTAEVQITPGTLANVEWPVHRIHFTLFVGGSQM